MSEPGPQLVDKEERRYGREVLIVALIVGVFILVGAIWTLLRDPPNPSEYSADRVIAEEQDRRGDAPEAKVAPPPAQQ